ncbi:GntR family transcriptional regulator [Corynebacterium uropygiale]|uniref:GntR family transcriptional regulator n=1 Tax=Corynebacterium uropygiale TaxID=1775911 RepID=A0A9X1QUE1_9CORY|nr:GntR family transcriptional regulator [Corynebacterium uropygiale]MCF4007709.1 GntR family transcriptional regulator [Corynebacterium uropygiale]
MASPRGRDLAYRYLTTHILVDPSVQGSFLSEQAIADDLGISRTPVREAIRALASEGLVEHIPHRGTRIPSISREQILDLMELRGLLEKHTTLKVIERGVASSVADRLSVTLEQQRRLLDSPGHEHVIEFIRLDQEFHARIMEAAGNHEISAVYEKLRVRQRIIGAQALYTPHRWREVIREHADIVDALRANDSQAALRAVVHHLDRTLDVLLSPGVTPASS